MDLRWHDRSVSLSESVRRRPATVLVVGAVEPEVQPWLRAAGHAVLAGADVDAALAAMDGGSAVELVVVDGERGGRDVAAVCRAIRRDGRTEDAWLLAISRGRADDALSAGADDYLKRPFSRGELLARARAGLTAARHRADDALIRALLLNVPGAIYRTAWHAGHVVELISDEIERISGHPPTAFLASTRRTLLSIVHADDLERVEHVVEEAAENVGAFALEYRIVRADGEVRWVLDRGHVARGTGGVWIDGALFDVTERRRAEEALRIQEIEDARTEELRASRVRIVQAADAAGGASSATSTTARSSGSWRWRSTSGSRGGGWSATRPRPPPTSSARTGAGAGAPRSCASSRAASTRRCSPITGWGPRSTRSSPAPRGRGGPRGARRAPARRGGDDGLLHGRRGAHERGQVRPREPGERPRRSRRTASSSSTSATTAWAARARRPAPG